MSQERYIRFAPLEDNVNQTVKADDINALQEAIDLQQQEDFRQGDKDFVNEMLFSLQNHPVANSVIYDLFSDNTKMNVSAFTNVNYYEDISAVLFEPSEAGVPGVFLTKAIQNPTLTPVRKALFMAHDYKPAGTSIAYEFSYDGVNFIPVTPGDSTPLETTDAGVEFFVRATMTGDETTGAFPRLHGWAVLYQDENYMFRFMEDGLDIDIEGAWDGTIVGTDDTIG